MEDIIYFNIDDIKYSIKKDNNKLLFYTLCVAIYEK